MHVAETATYNEIPQMPLPINLTARAVEMVIEAMRQEDMVNHSLRVGVVGGGCSGLQYLLDFTDKPTDHDYAFSVAGINVLVDPFSAAHLQGTTIDYVDGLQGAGFKFENPNVQRSCGCGSSFQ
jgi:iron-sulfur cluster assembly accessory protein